MGLVTPPCTQKRFQSTVPMITRGNRAFRSPLNLLLAVKLFQNSANSFLQVPNIYGHHQIFIRPVHKALHLIWSCSQCCNHNDWDMPRVRVPLQPLAHLEPVQFGLSSVSCRKPYSIQAIPCRLFCLPFSNLHRNRPMPLHFRVYPDLSYP